MFSFPSNEVPGISAKECCCYWLEAAVSRLVVPLHIIMHTFLLTDIGLCLLGIVFSFKLWEGISKKGMLKAISILSLFCFYYSAFHFLSLAYFET